MLGYARGMAELSQASVRGSKRAVDAIAAGMSQETPAYRALDRGGGVGSRLRRRAGGVRGQTDGEIRVSRPDRAAAAS